MTSPATETVLIERLAYGGAGVGHIGGKVCFVNGAVPGDQLRVRIHTNKRSYCEAELVDIVVAGSGRRVPPCPVFGQCGGCQWQHIAYDDQLLAKEGIFAQALSRTAKISADCLSPILPSPVQYGYRNRIQVKIRWVQDRLVFGFFRANTHFVVEFPPEGCMLAIPALNRALGEVRALFSGFPEPQSIPQLDLAAGDNGDMVAILHYLGKNQDSVAGFLAAQRACLPSISGMYLQSGRKHSIQRVYGVEGIRYHVPVSAAHHEACLHVSRGGFSQVNLTQNRSLVAEVMTLLNPLPADHILDLYCGNGNFSVPLAAAGAMVVGTDEYDGSIRDAVLNAQVAGVSASFSAGDAYRTVQLLLDRKERFTSILLDPPRTGASEIAGIVHGLGADKIVYVSCDPMTLARDLAIMTKNGYAVQFSRVVDMFPQTFHLESVTLLHRS